MSQLHLNEVAERASLIRKRYGNVKVVSGQNNDDGKGVNAQRQLKSQDITNRIAKLKHQLDQLTDNEWWIIRKIENVFLNARR